MKFLAAAALPAVLCGAATELNTVSDVDLKKYQGRWYEIARTPNRFQKDCVGKVTAEYTLLGDGTLEVVNRCLSRNGEYKEARGAARRGEGAGSTGKLKVRFAPAFLSFLPFVWGDYWLLDLADDYSYAVVGEPNREYLWILSRTSQMDPDTYQKLLDRVAEHGYDPSRIVRTQQITPQVR